MTTKKKLMTAEELARLPDDGKCYELLDGELIELPPPKPRHGAVMFNTSFALGQHVKPRSLGHILVGDPGIILRRGPDRVRGPDICFFAAGRFPDDTLPDRYPDLPPDFVVEIVSPDQSRAYVRQKIEEWLASGVRLVWAMYPRTRTVVAYTGPAESKVYQADDVITGAPVLPEFSVAVADLFG